MNLSSKYFRQKEGYSFNEYSKGLDKIPSDELYDEIRDLDEALPTDSSNSPLFALCGQQKPEGILERSKEGL